MSEEAPRPRDRYVTREEFAALTRRVWELEEELLRERARGRAPARKAADEEEDEVPFAVSTPTPATATAPRKPANPPVRASGPAPAPRQAAPSAARAPSNLSLEMVLGERFAPRAGAVLVFLAALFFLGVGIERGWVTPVMQLLVATGVSATLLGAGAWLTNKRGYGTYPQVLEGTAACILYAVAFSAHAVPYYQQETGLTELGGGLLMALVAGLTVLLALLRDARVIAGLGYALAFLTAGLGFGDLPAFTLAYVVILGTSLAVVVARRAWLAEAVAGSLLTGLFFVGFAAEAGTPGNPSPLIVTLTGLLPFGAFIALTFRQLEEADEALASVLAFLTVGWGVAATTALVSEDAATGAVGLALAGWWLGATLLCAAAAQVDAGRQVVTAYGAAAVLLYLGWPPAYWYADGSAGFAVTGVYAVGALALAAGYAATGSRVRGVWWASLALAGAAAFRAVFLEARVFPGEPSGTWEAWTTLLLLAPAFAILVALPDGGAHGRPGRRAAFLVAVTFLGAWAWALFQSPFLVTAYLVVTGVLLVGGAMTLAGTRAVPDAVLAGAALVTLAAVKATFWDAHGADLSPGLAFVEAVLVTGALLALFHVSERAGAGMDATARGTLLVGGSAVVTGSFVLGYVPGGWASMTLGLLGVLYLFTGFVLREFPAYRYASFAILGFVLLRVLMVDLANTDLVVRAAVFAVLGAILLGVGYAYSRANRAEAQVAAEPPTPPRQP